MVVGNHHLMSGVYTYAAGRFVVVKFQHTDGPSYVEALKVQSKDQLIL